MPKSNSAALSFILVLFLASMLTFGAGVVAQTHSGRTSSSRGSLTHKVQIRGTVQRVVKRKCTNFTEFVRFGQVWRGIGPRKYCMVDVILETKGGTRRVTLGPNRFLRQNQFFFVPGDRILVSGLLRQGSSTIVGVRVIRNKRALTLRDASGRPLWGPSRAVSESFTKRSEKKETSYAK